MPEIITTPNALVQTTNGKRFYVFSGNVTVDTNETVLLDIDNIGERDIKILFELGNDYTAAASILIKIKSNGVIVYSTKGTDFNQLMRHADIRLILPANTSLTVTYELGGGSGAFNLAGHGKYLSM